MADHVILHDKFYFFDSAGCLAELRNNPETLIFGAGRAGAIIAKELLKIGVQPKGFVDNNPVLKTFCDLPVWLPEAAFTDSPDAALVCAVTRVENVARQLLQFGITKAFSIGFLDAFPEVWNLPKADQSRDIPPQITLLQCAEYQKSLIAYPKSIRSGLAMELMITERCSLRCRDCGNLMQYYSHPENLNTKLLIQDLNAATDCLDFIPEVRVIGGEPLLHPDFHTITAMVAAKQNIGHVGIVTNGTLVPSSEQFKSLQNGKIYFRISNYGALSRKLDHLLEECDKHGVPAYVLDTPQWMRCRLTSAQGLDDNALRRRFQACTSLFCMTIMRGKLYHCEFAANGERIGGIPQNAANSIDLLHDAKTSNDLGRKIWAFIHGCDMLPACDYCPGFSKECEPVAAAIQTKNPLTLPGKGCPNNRTSSGMQA
jgi:Predicted Fe-S oxidoreductases